MEINDKQIKEILDHSSKTLCGRVLKRFEIIENKPLLKSVVRELIFEEYRNLRDLIYSTSKGLGLTKFDFRKEKE